LVSLEERSICGELDFFLGVGDNELNALKDIHLADKATRD